MTVTHKKRIQRKTPKAQGAKARRRPTGRRQESPTSFVALSLALVAIALALILVGLLLRSSATVGIPIVNAPIASAPIARTPVASAPTRTENSAETSPVSYRPEGGSKSQLPKLPTLPKPRVRGIVIIIDDAGYSMTQLEAFLRLPFPLTIAVLPGLPNSEKAAKAVRAAGKELILHQPMQAIGGQNPGPGAILLGMNRTEIERIIDANLATVPGAVGLNNHMGSAATADLDIMEIVAEVAKKRGIYYLDSRTTSGTMVPIAARREGIRYWERDVFLDNTPDRASIMRSVEDGKKRALKDRPAIMIGHVWSAELAQTLTDLYPQLISEGFSLSTISRYMVQEATEDDASPRD